MVNFFFTLHYYQGKKYSFELGAVFTRKRSSHRYSKKQTFRIEKLFQEYSRRSLQRRDCFVLDE